MSSIIAQQAKLDLEFFSMRKGWRLVNATGESILERLRENLHFRLSWMLLLSLPAIQHFSPLFIMDKKKKFDLNLEIFRDIFQICPRVHDQNFDNLPTDEDIMSFFKKLGHTREIKSNTDKVKRPAKKSTNAPIAGVVIREKGSDSEHKIDENETSFESDQEENEEDVKDDEEEKDDEIVITPSNSTDDEDETNVEDKAEGDEDKEIYYTTSQFNNGVDVRLNEPVNTNEGLIQKEDIPTTDAEIVSPMDVHVHHEIFPPQMQKLFLQWMFMSIMKVSALEKEVVELKKDDLLNTQVTALVDEHLDSRLGATRDEFLSYLSASITTRITKQVKIQLPQILQKEVLIKSYNLKKSIFSTYDKVYSLKRSRKDKDKDEDPSTGSDRGTKSQSKSSRKSVHVEEPEFEVADSDMPQDHEENLGKVDKEPKGKVASKRDWFTKPKQPQEPINPDWKVGKTSQQGPTQTWLMTLASSANKPSKTFDELIRTHIDFSAYIMNGLKITNIT
nr:hypothetical protein [Tanacetum cinerariifolium]